MRAEMIRVWIWMLIVAMRVGFVAGRAYRLEERS